MPVSPDTAPSFRKYLPVLISVCIAAFMVQLDISIVNIALPTLAEKMSADTSSVSRVVLFYLLAVVSTLLLFGRIGDRIGKKPLFIVGYGVFAGASVLCGLSGSLGELEAMRAVQGAGAAMLAATLGAQIISNVDEEYRGRAFSAISVFSGIGFAVGAPLGGLIVNHIGWRWIFFLNVIPGIIGMIMAGVCLRSEPPLKRKERFDIPGVLISSAALISFVFALNRGAEHGWDSPLILGLLIASAGLLVLFIHRLRTLKDPLIDPGIFRNVKARSGLIARMCVVGVLNGSMFLYPFFMSKVMGFSIGTTGLLIGIFPVIVLFVSPLSGWLADRKGPEKISVVASVLLVGATVLFLANGYTGSVHLLVASFTLFGIGGGLMFPSIMKLVMGQATEGHESMLSSVNSLASFVGSSLGIAMMETLFSLDFPRVHDFSGLPAASVSLGFAHAMFLSVAATVLVLFVLIRSAREPSKTAARA